MSTQYYQIKSIYAINQQTFILHLFFLFGTFVCCPVSHKYSNDQKIQWLWIFSDMQTVSMSHQ